MSRRIRLVLVDSGSAPLGALPLFDVETPWWPEVETVVTGARERFGVELSVLRVADVDGGKFMRNGLVTYSAEVTGALPDTARLEPVPHGLPLGDEPLRAAWARPGGIATTIAWADRALEARGTRRTGPVMQTKAWNLSSVLRVPIEGAVVWCKSVPPFLAHEGAIIGWLARERPEGVPQVLAADPARATVLLADLGSEELFDASEPQRLRMVREWVSLQARCASRIAELLAIGVPDQRAARLAEQVRELVARADVRATLDPRELPAVDALAEDLPRRLKELEAARLPETLVHGDFHAGNWMAAGGDLVLMDWGDSFVGHPMIDTAAFLDDIEDGLKSRILAAWADAWRSERPDSDPERAAELIPPVAALRAALTFRGFLDGIEPSEHRFHANDVPDWLRIAIAAAG